MHHTLRALRVQGGFLSSLDYRYGIAKRCRMITKRKEPGRILDIGCGVGHFLNGMKQRRWQVFGTEIREQFGLEVHVGELHEDGERQPRAVLQQSRHLGGEYLGQEGAES